MSADRQDSRAGSDNEPGELETDRIPVRVLGADDADAVARIDERTTGRSRRDYFRRKIQAALRDPGLPLSLAAEVDGVVVGFVLASVDYGAFGVIEPVAVLDDIGVHPDFRGRSIGAALVRQLALNLRGLRIERLRTEVDWRQQDLVGFFAHWGFEPAPRLCLDARVESMPIG